MKKFFLTSLVLAALALPALANTSTSSSAPTAPMGSDASMGYGSGATVAPTDMQREEDKVAPMGTEQSAAPESTMGTGAGPTRTDSMDTSTPSDEVEEEE